MRGVGPPVTGRSVTGGPNPPRLLATVIGVAVGFHLRPPLAAAQDKCHAAEGRRGRAEGPGSGTAETNAEAAVVVRAVHQLRIGVRTAGGNVDLSKKRLE